MGASSETHMEYAAEVWWTGGRSTCRKLESSQMKMGRRLLGISNTVARMAVQGNLRWRKLEGRAEGDVWLEVLEEGRLVKKW